MAEKVTKLALTSRIFVLVLQLIANNVITDHRASDVFNAVLDPETKFSWLDKCIRFCLRGLRHWDGEYFLHIAEYGYTYENTLAFYPLYPMAVKAGASVLHAVCGNFLNMRCCCLLVGVVLNVLLFCKAANILYTLTQRIFNDLNKSWNVALLFCFNPASIFFSAAYSETLFSLLTLYIMLECTTELRVMRVSVALALCVATRSNGLINLGFPLYFFGRRFILNRSTLLGTIFKMFISLQMALLPLTFFNFYAYKQFCGEEWDTLLPDPVIEYGHKKKLVLAGHRDWRESPWCDDLFPFPYSYIQSHYWKVGFLEYYEAKQIPNFILATPILFFLLVNCLSYLRDFAVNLMPKYPLQQLIKDYKSLPFVLHAIALTIFCMLFVHIQVSTRLLCSATPCVYWFAADYMPRSLANLELRSKAGLIVLWFASYVLVGTIMFSNNLPWT